MPEGSRSEPGTAFRGLDRGYANFREFLPSRHLGE